MANALKLVDKQILDHFWSLAEADEKGIVQAAELLTLKLKQRQTSVEQVKAT